MHDVLIREGRPADLDGLERLEECAFDSDRLSRRSLAHFLRAPTTDVPVATREGALVGYAMIGFRARSTLGRIFSLAVEPTCARRGLGRGLVEACLDRARARGASAVRLEVRADNPAAAALYGSCGFTLFGRYDAYYEDGAAALRFERPLGGKAEP